MGLFPFSRRSSVIGDAKARIAPPNPLLARAETPEAAARVMRAEAAWAAHQAEVANRMAAFDKGVREASGVDVASYYLPSAGGMSLYRGHPKPTVEDE
jgi:hypothetical protein